MRTDGIRVRPGRTPICILAYQPDGRCHCLYDPGLTALADLDEGQRALLAAAKAICVTVGPTKATWEALRLARPDAMLVWAVKADPRAVPPDLAAALAARADIVVFSQGEAEFAAEACATADKPARRRIDIETRGRERSGFHARWRRACLSRRPGRGRGFDGRRRYLYRRLPGRMDEDG